MSITYSAYRFNLNDKTLVGYNLEVSSKLGKALADGFIPCTNGDPELKIILCNDILFCTNRWLSEDESLENDRKVSSNIKESDLKNSKYTPFLVIYDSNCFSGIEKLKRMWGFQFWDSSIWQRWVDVSNNYSNNLNAALEQLKFFFQKGLYREWPEAKEYIEFSTRLYNNSYIGKTGRAGHAGSIVPFPFHEESKMFLKNQETIDTGIGGLKYRVLVIDDKAEKVNIIKELLSGNGFGGNYSMEGRQTENNRATLFFDHAASSEDAIKLLKEKNYDIILLDYLLGGDIDNRQLSINLLKQIENEAGIKMGPGSKLHIMAVTAYQDAFNAHLWEEGIAVSTDKWIIQRGADLVNTPNAFVYNFNNLVQHQLAGIAEKDHKRLSDIWKSELKKLPVTSIKNWAFQTQNKVFAYWSAVTELQKLAKDNTNGSLLAASYIKAFRIDQDFSNGLFSYIAHFLNLLIFSDGYEWEEMITDLDVIKKLIENDDSSLAEIYKYINERMKTIHDR